MRTKHIKTFAVIVISVLLLAGVAGLVVLSLSGRLVIVTKSPSQKVVLQPYACDNLVTKFNQASIPFDGKKMAEVQRQAASVRGANQDITCVYIRLYAELQTNKIKEAEQSLRTYNSLAARGQRINGNVVSPLTPAQLSDYLGQIKKANSGKSVQGTG